MNGQAGKFSPRQSPSISPKNVDVIFRTNSDSDFAVKEERDLQSFHEVFNLSSGKIKGIVQDLQTPDSPNAITSTWSTGSNRSNLSNADGRLALFCWVLNVSNNPFPVDIGKNMTVGHLKEAIKKKKERTFDGIDPDTLELWKLSSPILSADIDTKFKDVQSPQGIPGCVKLKAMDKLSEHFSSTPRNHLHIIVEAPPTHDVLRRPDGHQRPSKRRRLSGAEAGEAIPDVFTTLWRTFWGRSATECFIEHTVRIPDSRTLELSNDDTKFTYLKLPGGSKFPCDLQRILVTETYKSLYADLCEEDSRWLRLVGKSQWVLSSAHSTVITGQPGIGKTTGLSYILVRRLQDKKPTVYCDDKDFAYIFTDAGVQKVSCAVQHVVALDGLTASCCALVNIHPGMTEIPLPFYPSSFRRSRVVVAASPNPTHVMAFKESRAEIYTLPTWGWDDLYCASMINNDPPLTPPNDEKLLNVFTKFRGIPRRCFRALFFGQKLELEAIEDAIDEIKSITEFTEVTSGSLPFKKSSSHILVRVEPTDGQWGDPVTELLSKYVAGLLEKRIRLHQSMTIRNSIDHLLRTSQARRWAGNLFERAIHRRFRGGITFCPEIMDDKSLPLEIKIDPVRSEADGYFHTLSLRMGTRSRKVAINFLNQYLIPLSPIAETIDSVYISKEVTVFFQITVSPSHSLNLKDITELTDELPSDAKKRICIVFVLPDHDTTLKPYKRQKIVVPPGTPDEISTKVRGYDQYVYYARLDEI